MKPTYDRQARIFDPTKYSAVCVAIIGLGNIGSNAAVMLAKLGVKKLILVDHDTVEAHNLASQFYTSHDGGKLKTEALAESLRAIQPDIELTLLSSEYWGEPLEASILVSAVDSLAIRRRICAGMKRNKYQPFVIDGRAGGGQVEMYSCEAQNWRETLKGRASVEPCGARFIAYASGIIGAMIANQVKRVIVGETLKTRVLFHCDSYQVLAS
jgi:tRNA A37 threonylcarbamoyladenosine dehydratase